ncbi:thialysine N-epsilon-acetyltransferase-like isoform X2 [Corticium candelabrum]|uniref:thialysine N-epsilon-acetyltransferase-like isoform X2 n=1 Tax=Corticium candelabrum TaxID=121492 RepID=UPI002E25D48B|nr:thialysine N-epsilon-acetyltransferase-like isoform X2 [Corticium candelabrum]
MSWVVRESVDEDVPELLVLMKELIAAHQFNPIIMKSKKEDLLKDGFGEHDAKHFHVFVAELKTEAERRIIGYGLYILHYSGLGGRLIYLKDLYTKKEYQTKGIGRALMAKIAEMATRLNCFKLEWRCLDSNAGAITFYNNLRAKTVEKAKVFLAFIEKQGIEQLVVKSVQLRSDIKICYGMEEDVPEVMGLLKELAVIKGDDPNCIKSKTDLIEDGFCEPRRFYLAVAKVQLDGSGLIVHVEDFYVKKTHKDSDIETALIKKIAEFAKEHSCCKISLKYVLDGAEAPAFLEGLEVTLMPDWTFMYLDKPAIENLVAWQH